MKPHRRSSCGRRQSGTRQSGTRQSGTGQSGRGQRQAGKHSCAQEAEACLRALAGPAAVLREDQWTAIRALVEDRVRALVVQRTGWGKSAVYFTATSLLRARGSGPAVIVSPLLALMRNQIEAAARAGIRARTVNSANTERLGGGLRRGGGRPGGRPASKPGAAQQPGLPRSGPAQADRLSRACWWWTRRIASPTGVTTSGRITGGCGLCSPSCRPAYQS